ncbi:MAG: peptidoglycan-binding protein [Deltaproteobacteria bacterium]|nr:peptidoglycan-binding protein [Deltaproteobacteria bacterium]
MTNVKQVDQRGNRIISEHLKKHGPLEMGDQAKAVQWAERMLKVAGFDPGPMDRKFTAKTARAISQFQASVGLTPTGEFNRATFNALKKVEDRVHSRNDVFMGRGEKGKDVLHAEQRLRKLGYDVGKVDGIYDADTARAVKAFRADQADLEDGFGSMRRKAFDALKREAHALDHDPYHGRVTKNVKQHKRLDELTAAKANETWPHRRLFPDESYQHGFGPGSEGRHVANVQAHLKAAGYNPGVTDGKYDDRTEAMVKRFQKETGLEVTGRVDRETWHHLKQSYLYATGTADPAQFLGEHSAAVKKTERALKAAGYDPGKIDGVFDERTEKAVKKFEKQHKLKVDGKVTTGQLAAIVAAKKDVATGKAAYKVAHSLLGKNASWVKTHEPLGKYMPDWVGNTVNCASFVTACHQKAGTLKANQHQNSCRALGNMLDHDKAWKRVSLKNAKPGDIVIFDIGHTVLFGGWRNGRPWYIGSNNANSDGTQRITQGYMGYPIRGIWQPRS